jgi:hypothetical protein
VGRRAASRRRNVIHSHLFALRPAQEWVGQHSCIYFYQK